MKKALYTSLLAVIFFSACQGSEESEQLQENEYTVSIMARIGKTASEARYQQGNEKDVAQFIKNDDIGVFMDNGDVVCWVFDETAWSTSKSVFWEDKESEHIFCAYYPYTNSEAPNKERIKMPSLNNQNGSWVNIAQYDFLVASKTLSYQNDNGNVAFVDDSSFKHVSSLLKINIKGEGDMAKAVIDKITLKGNDLMTQTYYSFVTNNITIDGTPKETFSITPEHSMDSQDISYYFILNGTKTAENIDSKVVTGNSINLIIEYTSNSKKYIAQREGLSSGLLSGRIYEYNILVKDRNVIITGGNISGWTPGNEIEDIIINGEETTSINE